MFPHDAGEVRSTCGYHPGLLDLEALLDSAHFPRLLVVGGTVRDVVDLAGATRAAAEAVELPSGLYWFSGIDAPVVMAVNAGSPSSDGAIMPVDQLDNEDEPLTAAYGWGVPLGVCD
jgi:hypothetical protein